MIELKVSVREYERLVEVEVIANRLAATKYRLFKNW